MRIGHFNSGWAFAALAFCFSLLPHTCTASDLAQRTPPQIPATPFYLFANGNQAENIRPRSSGQLLVTINSAAELYQINPFANQSGGLVHRFDGYTSLFGIVELQPDLFYVTAGNYTGAPDYWGFAGTFSVFQVDLRGIRDPTTAQSAVQVSKVVDIPDAGLLDGFTVVNAKAGLLASGDAESGTIFLINVKKSTATAVYQDPILVGTATDRQSGLSHIGTNGLKMHGTDLYFTNTAKNTYGKIPLGCMSGKRNCGAGVIANYGTITDDFSFDNNGNAFISVPFQGIIFRPADSSAQSSLLTALFGANSNAFGRAGNDSCVLYSTFVGGTSGVARIDTTGQGFCCNLDDDE
ncbi:hypothetical protein MMC30_004254 [Trapelia coarctata]|nr:hypothetical protein [Trapelia coarctata]